METIKLTGLFPEFIIHPGETIQETLEDRNILIENLSYDKIDIDYLKAVLDCKENITEDFANDLEDITGVDSGFWLRYQDSYTEKYNRYLKEVEYLKETAGLGEVDSKLFAKYLTEKLKNKLNSTKLQKFLYMCYGLFLKENEKCLLKERPKAWDFGPVFPSVHSCEKKGKLENIILSEKDLKLLSKYDDLIDRVVKEYDHFTATELSNLTHEDGTAWSKKYSNGKKYEELDIYDIFLDFI